MRRFFVAGAFGLLDNAKKAWRATDCAAKVERLSDSVRFSVEDSGAGFPLVRKRGHLKHSVVARKMAAGLGWVCRW